MRPKIQAVKQCTKINLSPYKVVISGIEAWQQKTDINLRSLLKKQWFCFNEMNHTLPG